MGVFSRNLIGDCGGHENITVLFQQLPVRYDIREEIRHRAEAVPLIQQVINVKAVRVIQSAVGV